MLRFVAQHHPFPCLFCVALLALAMGCGNARENEPESLELQLKAGEQLLRDGRLEDAVQLFETMSGLHPRDPRPLRKLAVAHVLLRKDRAAVQEFERAAKLDSELSSDDLTIWATALQRLKRPDDAIAKYEAVLRVDPTHVPAMNNLALLLKKKDVERATHLLEEAVRLEPGDMQLVYNLGRTYETTGRFEESYNLIRRAVASLDPGDRSYQDRRAHLEKLKAKLPRGSVAPGAPNILLILIDTLRADHVGTYGYPRKTTPNIDAFAKEGVVFENAISQAPWTLPSVGTIFTGLYPSVHGLDRGIDLEESRKHARGSRPLAIQRTLSPAQLTLAEILRREGYQTVGFVSQIYLNSMFGFAQGFDVYNDGQVEEKKQRGATTNRSVFEWLESHREEPFFLFVHYNDPHHPYDPPDPFGKEYIEDYTGSLTPEDTMRAAWLPQRKKLSREDIEYVIGLYDGEVAYVDDQVGQLLGKFSSLNLQRDLMTVITSDHGEEFLDHGWMGHGHTLYEELLRVPLILHYPEKIAPARVRAQVRLIDLMPTILELAGVKSAPATLQGKSLEGALAGSETKPRDDLAFSEATMKGDWKSVRTGEGLKLVQWTRNGVIQLFDVEQDPREKRNLAAEKPSVTKSLQQELRRWSEENRQAREATQGEGPALQEVTLDAKTQAQLKALGYVD